MAYQAMRPGQAIVFFFATLLHIGDQSLEKDFTLSAYKPQNFLLFIIKSFL